MINCFFSLRPYSNDPWSTVSSVSEPIAMIHDQLFLQPQTLQQNETFPSQLHKKNSSFRTDRISHRTHKPVTMLKCFVQCPLISEKNCFVWGFCYSQRLLCWWETQAIEMKISTEHWWNDTDRRILKYSEKNLSQFSYFRHKSHMDWPVIESGPLFPVKMTEISTSAWFSNRHQSYYIRYTVVCAFYDSQNHKCFFTNSITK